MAYANNKISTILESQIPAFVRDDHHNFVQFVKSYYEFLEQVTPPVDIPLVFENPDEAVYNDYNPYGKAPLVVGEVLEQYANDNDPTDLTATATVFAYNTTTTTKTVTVTTIGGSLGRFLRNKEIVGKTSGAIYWPSKNINQAKPGAVQAAYDVGNIRDLDRMISQYLKFIKNEIASGFPVNFSDGVDSRTALKNLRDFYQSKGTENSFKLLFRLVFGEDIELYLPSEDMLRSSVGEIQQRTVIRLSRPTSDFITGEIRTEADLVGQVVTGESSGATALVEKAQVITYAGASFVETDISDKVGTFQVGENIRVAYVDAVTNTPVTLLLTNYGVVDSINITEGGSNYALGDRIEFTGGAGTGLLAEVTEVDSSGAIKNITIIDPGVNFTSAPTITIAGPHSGEIGYTRFNSGPLETLLDYNFTSVSSSNSFFSESDRRGAYANTGAVGFDIYETNGAFVLNPAEVDANSYSNFVSIPGVDEGLNAWWKFDTYNITGSVQINTLDGTFNDGNDPTANLDYQGYWGPRVGDSVFVSDSRIAAFGYGALDPLETHQHPSQNALTSNTYNTAGITGFKPVVLDSSGNGRHAWLQTRDVLAAASGFTGRANVFSKGAFSANGIYQLPEVATVTTANSWVNGPNGVDDQKSLGGVVLRSHDDLRNANTQTWVMWYYPYGEIGYFGGTYNNDTAWAQYASTAAQFDANNAPNILSRDGGAYWALQANATSTSSSDYHDVIFRFQGATWDNGNAANGQIANTSGLYPGHTSGTLNAGGGSLRAQTWNMIALSIDHTNLVGNIYFFNTTDGFHSSNGFSIPASQDANTISTGGWPSLNGDIEGRAVVMGAASASANGDSNSVEQNPASSAHGRYAEVRYYDKALNAQQIVHLFKNPGGRFNKTLSGDWAIVNPAVSGNVASEVIYDSGESEYVIRLGSDDTATGLQLVYDEDFDFDPTAHYKMTVKAKNSGATYTANVQFGVVGIANTGTRLLGYDASDDWDFVQPIVQSGASLGTSWVTKTAVFGGNTSQSGWDATGDGEGTYDWASPAKLYGEVGAISTTGNTTFFRPVLRWDDWAADEATNISYVKIEAQRDATLTATLAGEFTWPRESIGDAGKLSSSVTNSWTPQYLSDNNFYQTYSYVIRSGLSLDRYFDVVTRLTHTSGKKLFGEVNYVTKVSASPSTSAFVDSVLRLFVDYYGGAESLLIGEDEAWDRRSLKGDVAFKSDFGLYDMPDLPFDLDLAHGEFDIRRKVDPEYQPDIVVDFTGATFRGAYNQVADLSPDVNNSEYDARLEWQLSWGSFETTANGVKIRRDPTQDNSLGTSTPYLSLISAYGGAAGSSYSFKGSDYPYVRILMRKLEGTNGYWTGTLFPGIDGNDFDNGYPFTNGGRVAEEPHWTSDFQWVTWDMSVLDTWNSGIITDLRFDFERNWPYNSYSSSTGFDRINKGQAGELSDGVFEIKRIEFLSTSAYQYGSSGPAWIAWDQSAADNPYAKKHYSVKNLPDPTFATSNTATRPTKNTLIWEVTGAHSRLVTSYEEEYNSFKAGGDVKYNFTSTPTYPASYAGTDETNFEFGSLPYLSPQTRWSADNGLMMWETTDPGSVGYIVLKHDGSATNFPQISTIRTPNSFGTNVIGKQVEKVRVRMKRTSDTSPDDAVWSGTMFWGLGYDGADFDGDGNVLPNDYPFGAPGALTTTQPTWGSDWHDVDWDVSTTWENVNNIGDIRFDFDRNATSSATPNIYYIESITFIMKDQNVLALDGHYHTADDGNDGILWQNIQGLPLDIDSSKYRYVRMKVRRIGPGGYGTNDWLGACQGETTKWTAATTDVVRRPAGASYYRPEVGGANIGANTISQPSTLIIPAGSDPSTKSPWHILEWDMHNVNNGSVPQWLTGVSTRSIPTNTFELFNLGWLGITLTGNPTEDVEKYEIDWIQVDDGTKYPRGNHVWPIARTNQVKTLQGSRDQFSSGAGVGGNANTVYVNDSWDYSTRAMGRSSVAVSTPQGSTINFANTAGNNATVIYVSKTRSSVSLNAGVTIQVPTDDGCRVMRISANTANTTDWIVSDQLSANTDLDSYVLMSDMASTYQNWDVVSLELDKNDTIFVGHLYAEDTRSNPGTSFFATPSNRFSDDSRPFFVMHYQPTQNVAPSGVVGGNTGHNFYGVSNTYNSEIVFFGNTATTGAEILANGPRVFNVSPVDTAGQFSSLEHFAGVDMIIDDRANLNMVGRDSDNMVMIKPAPGKSRDGTDSEQLPLVLGIEPRVFDVPYNEGMGTVRVGPSRDQTVGVQEFEIANSTTLDSNNVALGTWAPHGIIQGPKGSFFVACNNYNTAFGTNSIYCYHVIASQNVATGVYSALNVYPVYANTSHTTDTFQGCTGMAIDSHDPPNFYYATSNTIFKIEPKGYSYEIGDTKITQLIPDTYDYWNTNFTNGATVPPLGWYPATHADPGTYNQQMEGTYGRIKVDARDRLFLRGRANVYLYDTSNNEITTAYSPQEYQADIVTTGVDATYENLVIADWDVEPETGELVFVLSEMGTGKALVASVRPNANMSYTYADGGQLAQVLIDPAYTTNRYETPLPTLIGPGGGSPTGFKTWVNAKIRIRKKKDSD